MTETYRRLRRTLLLVCGLLALPGQRAWAQKTDVVTLLNGDTLTCEIQLLDRGRLQVSTDHLGRVNIEWDKVVRVTASRLFRVETSAGLRLLGRLATSAPQRLDVIQETGAVTIDLLDVVAIVPVGGGFWSRADGAVDLGFSYTKSSGIAQLSVAASLISRGPTRQIVVGASSYFTGDRDGNETARHAVDFGLARYIRRQGLWLLQGGFMRNRDLGYNLRSTVSAGAGRFLARSNRHALAIGAGISTSREVSTQRDSTQQLEALVSVRQSYFTYDTPKTDTNLSVDIYPSLSDWGRVRVEFDGRVKRDLVADFAVGVSIYDSYDSRPPTAGARRNDVGLSLTIGWTF